MHRICAILKGLNPLKRVNSILCSEDVFSQSTLEESQSPQAGQFNSYEEKLFIDPMFEPDRLNPLKRVNSILTSKLIYTIWKSIFVSITSSGSIQFLLEWRMAKCNYACDESQSPQAGQFNSYTYKPPYMFNIPLKVSIPSSGSIQFLLVDDVYIMNNKLCLNPLKRVNSILTFSSNLSFNNYQVSIPSSGSIQFLHRRYAYS